MSKHKFKTDKQAKKGNLFRFICAFLAFAVVFGSISAVVILKNNDISLRDLFSEKTTTDPQGETGAPNNTAQPKGSANILIYGTNTDVTELYFMALVCADMDAQGFKVLPLSTEKKPGGKSYAEILSEGGYKALTDAVRQEENVEIDRYISSDENTFALAINYMGGLEYEVDERIEYRNDDYTLILTRGKQTVKGETLLKYFRYAKTLGTDGLKLQGSLVCAMLDSYINEQNLNEGINIYQKVLSKLKSASDISYIEASRAITELKLFCASDKRMPAIVVMTLEG